MATYNDKYLGDASSMIPRPKEEYTAFGTSPTNPSQIVTPIYTNQPAVIAPNVPRGNLQNTMGSPNVARPDLGGIVNLARPPAYNPNVPNKQMATEQFERLARTSPASVSGAQRRAVQAADMAAKAETQGKPLTKFEQRLEEIKLRGEEARKTVGEQQKGKLEITKQTTQLRRELADKASKDKTSLAEYNRGTEEKVQGLIASRQSGNREDEQRFQKEIIERNAELEAAQKDTDYARSVQEDFRNNVFKNKQEAVSAYLKTANEYRLNAFKEGGDESEAEAKAQAMEAKAGEAMKMGEQGSTAQEPAQSNASSDVVLADANKDGIVDEQERLTIISELPQAESLLSMWKNQDPKLNGVDRTELKKDIERAMQVVAKGKIWKQQFQPKA